MRQDSEKVMIRAPVGLRERIKAGAQANRRSVNSEIVFILERAFPAPAAATGAKFGDQTPAAALNPTALAGGENINPDV